MRREQLLDLGLAPRTLHRRTDEGLFTSRGRRVLVFAGTPAGLLTESLVAAQAVHPDGLLTGYSALAVLGSIDEDPWSAIHGPLQPWIRLPGHQRLPARVIRGSARGAGRQILGVRLADQDGVVADLMQFLPWDDAERLAYRLAQRLGPGLFTLLSDAAEQAGQAPGARQLRRIVALLATGARSHAEQEIVRLLVAAGFADFRLNHPVHVGGRLFLLDIAFPEVMLAIEVDGRAFHSDATAFQADRTRQNLLVSEGWRVLRFTWHDITQRPDHVLRQVAEQL